MCEFVIGDVVSLILPSRIGPMLNMKDAIVRIQPDQKGFNLPDRVSHPIGNKFLCRFSSRRGLRLAVQGHAFCADLRA